MMIIQAKININEKELEKQITKIVYRRINKIIKNKLKEVNFIWLVFF